jgi:hypothetical protein
MVESIRKGSARRPPHPAWRRELLLVMGFFVSGELIVFQD